MKELGPVSGEAFLLLKDAVDKLGEAILKLNENQRVMLTAIGGINVDIARVNVDIGELRQRLYQLDKKEKSDG